MEASLRMFHHVRRPLEAEAEAAKEETPKAAEETGGLAHKVAGLGLGEQGEEDEEVKELQQRKRELESLLESKRKEVRMRARGLVAFAHVWPDGENGALLCANTPMPPFSCIRLSWMRLHMMARLGELALTCYDPQRCQPLTFFVAAGGVCAVGCGAAEGHGHYPDRGAPAVHRVRHQLLHRVRKGEDYSLADRKPPCRILRMAPCAICLLSVSVLTLPVCLRACVRKCTCV